MIMVNIDYKDRRLNKISTDTLYKINMYGGFLWK